MERKAYPSDVSDEQWALIEPMLPRVLPWGRPRTYSYREIVNGLFYLAKTGCQWRALPHDLPPWSLLCYYFSIWKKSGLWQRIHDTLVKQSRRGAGREEDPSAAILDSQSVKTTEMAPADPQRAEKRGCPKGTCRATMRVSRSKAGSATSSSIPRG